MNWLYHIKRAQERGQEHWNQIGKYGVSKISACMLKSWLEIMGKKTETYKPTFELNKAMWVGTASHELIQTYLKEENLAQTEVEVRYKGRNFEVLSYIDVLLEDGTVVDIKTTWAKLENYDTQSAIHQTNFYMGCIGAKKGGVLVYSLSNPFGEINDFCVDFVEIEFDPVMFAEDIAKYERLTDYLEKEEIPEEYDMKLCKYCQYSMMCPKKADKDNIYGAYWDGFWTERKEYPKRVSDAQSDGYVLEGDVL